MLQALSVYVLRTLLAIAAGWLLFVLYRRIETANRAVGRMVAAGILLRAVAGQVLFWVSYLHVPLFRNRQLGDGFWWFGSDSTYYYNRAADAAHQGWRAIVFLNRTEPSVSYIQILAAAMVLFGTAVSVGLLLNLLAYVTSCILAVRLASYRSWTMLPAIAALTFAPTAVLWTTQPLKDVVCWMLVIAVVAATAEWATAWSRADNRLWHCILTIALLCAAVFGLAGIRWYFALALLVASLPLFGMTAVRAQKRWRAAVAAAATVVLAFYAFLFGAGPYAPTPAWDIGVPRTAIAGSEKMPAAIAVQLEASRNGSRGATTIAVGPVLAAVGGRTQQTRANHRLIAAAGRICVGTIAIFIPRVLAERLGLIAVGRGTGMAFADLDALFFDAVAALCAFAVLCRMQKHTWFQPLFWAVLLSTVVMTLAIAYVETNLGTLTRHRGMLLVSVILLLIVSDERGRLSESESAGQSGPTMSDAAAAIGAQDRFKPVGGSLK